MNTYLILLFAHVLAAMLAFGTAMLAFPIIGAFGEKEPAHFGFALRVNYAIGRRAVTPLAIATFGLGLLLVHVGHLRFFETRWIWISTVLAAITVADAQLITLPAVRRLVELSAAGPTPEMTRLLRKVKIGGTLSALLLVCITLLMIWKPA